MLFSYSFTASDGSEESTAGRVMSPCSIMMHHGLGMQESKNIDYAKQHHTPHCWLPAKVMHPANSTKRFSWLTRSTSILLMKNVHIYMLTLVHLFTTSFHHKYPANLALLLSSGRYLYTSPAHNIEHYYYEELFTYSQICKGRVITVTF